MLVWGRGSKNLKATKILFSSLKNVFYLWFNYVDNLYLFMHLSCVKNMSAKQKGKPGIKCYLFASEQIRNLYTQDHEFVSKNAG